MSEDSKSLSTRSTIPSSGSTTSNLRHQALRNESSFTSFPSTSSHDDLSNTLPLSDTSHPLPPIPPLFADRAAYGNKTEAYPAPRTAPVETEDDLHLRQTPEQSDTRGGLQPRSDPPPFSAWEQTAAFPQSLPVTQTIPYRQRPDVELPGALQEPQIAVLSDATDRNVKVIRAFSTLDNKRSIQHASSPVQSDRSPKTNIGIFLDFGLGFPDALSSLVTQPPQPSLPSQLSAQSGQSPYLKVVGNNASLLSTKKTLDMYRANVKKTNDPTVQYEFAIFMVQTAQDASNGSDDALDGSASDGSTSAESRVELLREARHILQKLSDRSYPFAQYYLADGYASGMFSKGKEDYDRAFPLFIAASKHGHAEAGYRAALCYEFGWGTRKDPPKAAQFFRQAASKNHPGAASRLGRACLVGDLGLGTRYKEGIKWLKRAAESADFQYNNAPYELGLLHETGYGDDIFLDESYAAQLFTQSADLGHMEANYRLGDAYEHGKLRCPKDPALSVHFYTGAAQKGHPLALMALCAWYMVGAPPVLEKDENEAYEWAKKAAETGLPKAEYAVGYFTEMGIGCRRDPLEANVWYVRAADQGDQRAKHRIAAIRAAASGGAPPATTQEEEKVKHKRFGLF
ncbi:MAG: hypothetical protein Q9196_004911 [Gyalolechia fulgens]